MSFRCKSASTIDGTWMRYSYGRLHYLWRAVDQDGDVLDILVQTRRDKKAAKKFFRKLLKGLRYVPRVLITDKLELPRGESGCNAVGRTLAAEISEQPC